MASMMRGVARRSWVVSRELRLVSAAVLGLGLVLAVFVGIIEPRSARGREGVLLAVAVVVAGAASGLIARRIARSVRQLRAQRTVLEAANVELARRLAEQSDLKSHTDHILDSLTSGIVTFDLAGRVATLNAAAEALTGVTFAEARGRACSEAFSHIPELAELVRETLARRAGGGRVSASVAGREAAPVPIELTTGPLKDAEEKNLGVVAVLRDLTAVRQRDEQLRRSDRLAAVGTLAAGLAHEIKNPLTSILTFSRQLARRFDDERFRTRFQSVVPRELERINGIVDGLLRLSRSTRVTLGAVHLHELLDEGHELYANQLEAKQITVTRRYDLELPAIEADREQLYRALVNLIANALDAMSEGGTLTLRTGWGDEADAVVTPGPWVWGRPVKLEISDTGPGIPPGQVPEIFNPFFTTKPSGTGLGLAIVHRIVEEHGGAITFRSTPARGTTFTILLPVSLTPYDGQSVEAPSPAGEPRLLG